MTDPISDMLTRIRNAVTAKHTRVDLPASKLKAEIARILQDEGYIQGFRMVEEPAEKTGQQARQMIRLFLKYGPHGETRDQRARAHQPSRAPRLSRRRRRADRAWRARHDILTTSRGVMTGRAAKKAGVGGEVLCNVW